MLIGTLVLLAMALVSFTLGVFLMMTPWPAIGLRMILLSPLSLALAVLLTAAGVLLGASLPLPFWRYRHLCGSCGYDIRGVDYRECPECGAARGTGDA